MSTPFLLDSFVGTAGVHLRTSVDGRVGTDAAGTSNGLQWAHVTDEAVSGDQAGTNPGFGVDDTGTRARNVFNNPNGVNAAFTYPTGGTGTPPGTDYDVVANIFFPDATQNCGVLLRWDTAAAAGAGNGYYSRITNGVVSLARLAAGSGVAVASGQTLNPAVAAGQNRILRYAVRTSGTTGNPVLTVMLDGVIPSGMNAVEDTGAAAVHKLAGLPGLRLSCDNAALSQTVGPQVDGVLAMAAGSTGLTPGSSSVAPGTSAVSLSLTGTGTGWKALGATADPSNSIFAATGRVGLFRISGTTQPGSGAQVASISSCTINSDTSSTLQFVPGTNAGTVTLLDITTGQTATVAVTAAASFTAAPTAIPAGHAGNITLTLTGTGTSWSSGATTFTISGVTGAAKVGQSITASTAATLTVTTGTGTGTLTIGDGTNSATVTVGTATIALSPSSGSTGVNQSVAVTGTNTVWTQETAATLFGLAGGTGASLSGITVADNTHASFTLTNGSAAGTLTITANPTGATAPFTVGSGPVTIPVTDANWSFSPYLWNVAGGAAVAVAPGQYFKIGFTGTSANLLIDATSLNPPVGQGTQPATAATPSLYYSVDRGPRQQYILPNNATGVTSLALATGLAAGTHYLRAWLATVDRAVNEWSPVYTSVSPAVPTSCLRITGLVVDAGAASAPYRYWDGTAGIRPKRALFYGDSFAIGNNALAVANAQSGGDASQAFPRHIAEALDAEYGVQGWSHQGWCTAGYSGSNAPPMLYDGTDADNGWNKIYAGVYIPGLTSTGGTFATPPDYIVICQGSNDGGQSIGTTSTQGTLAYSVQTLLTKLRSAAPNAHIFVLNVPGNRNLALGGGTLGSFLASAVAAYVSGAGDARTHYVDAGAEIDEGGFGLAAGELSLDGQHPTPLGHATWGARYAGLIRSLLGGGALAPLGRSLVGVSF